MTDFEAIVAYYENDPMMAEVYAHAQAEINKIVTRRTRIAKAVLATVAVAATGAVIAIVANKNES